MREDDGAGSQSGSGATTPATAGAVAQVFVADLDELEVTPDDERHLAQVLRLRRGEKVVASDGEGHWRTCRFTGAASRGTPRSSILEPAGPVTTSVRIGADVTIAFVPVKGGRPEWVVQKLTEAGVDHIVVIESLRAVVRWHGERGARAVERLRRVAREAAAQSRRSWLPEVVAVGSLHDLRSRLDPVPLALAQLGGGPPSLRAPAVAIGPEGGWDSSETSGYPLVGLGPNVLRAETAAVAAGVLICALREGLVGLSTPSGAPPPPGTDT